MRYKALLLAGLIALAHAQPITGEADSLVFEKDRLIYRGKVRLVRGESVLRADRVTILLNEEGKPEKLIAEGNVVYTEPGRKATSSYAEYDLRTEVIVLRGRARVEEEKNLIEAEEIVYDRKSGLLKASGGGKRVRTIYIEEEKDEEVGHKQGDSQKKGNTPEEGEDDS
ncbi:MAG: lipopolysaccharide transport periplasmic protein LptA [Aquificota bacterium]|nr:lipopolysaccharide transport periplasmic protein LptA [Aquificota bacterium]